MEKVNVVFVKNDDKFEWKSKPYCDILKIMKNI